MQASDEIPLEVGRIVNLMTYLLTYAALCIKKKHIREMYEKLHFPYLKKNNFGIIIDYSAIIAIATKIYIALLLNRI